jgi:hypothetical protein
LGSWKNVRGYTSKIDIPYCTISYIRPIFLGYVRGYTPKIWPEKWYVYVPPYQRILEISH